MIHSASGRRDFKQCPRCGTTMLLERIMAKFGPLPETRRYKCPECRCVAEEEIDRAGSLLSAIRFTGLADWLGTRRVTN
jgi:predicted nucleic-acid-binding Zn-ribbon protein